MLFSCQHFIIFPTLHIIVTSSQHTAAHHITAFQQSTPHRSTSQPHSSQDGDPENTHTHKPFPSFPLLLVHTLVYVLDDQRRRGGNVCLRVSSIIDFRYFQWAFRSLRGWKNREVTDCGAGSLQCSLVLRLVRDSFAFPFHRLSRANENHENITFNKPPQKIDIF